MVHEISDSNFEKKVIKSEKIFLIDFWAPWCGPCMMMSPIIDELAEEFQDKVEFGKVNVDENSEIASKYEIMSIPSIKIFKKGEIVSDFTGVQSKEALREELKKNLA
jgi:thioredoxin 1